MRRTEALDETYHNIDNDPRGPWTSSSYVNPATKERRPNLVYSIINPHTGLAVDHPTHAWKYSVTTHQEHVEQERLWWGVHGKNKYPRLKSFLSESQSRGIVPIDLMLADIGGTTESGTRHLQDVFQRTDIDFNNPKPIQLIQNLIAIAEGACSNQDFVVLDCFAGSGTTAHAVLALNKEDGGNRKFILVECEDYADTITAERARRVISGVKGARDKSLQAGLGGSFTYCTLGAPIDAEGMLTGENLPEYAKLAAYLLHVAVGISVGAAELQPHNDDGLFYSSDTTDYYLRYAPSVDFLSGNRGMLYEEQAHRISAASQQNGRRAMVFGPGKYIGQRELTRLGITFCQLPYEIHRTGRI